MNTGQGRYTVLLSLLDDPEWAEAVPDELFRRTYELDKQIVPAHTLRSACGSAGSIGSIFCWLS